MFEFALFYFNPQFINDSDVIFENKSSVWSNWSNWWQTLGPNWWQTLGSMLPE
jgi:hypothetical protein